MEFYDHNKIKNFLGIVFWAISYIDYFFGNINLQSMFIWQSQKFVKRIVNQSSALNYYKIHKNIIVIVVNT